MTKKSYNAEQLHDLILQMMETELGGEQVYLTALQCVQNADLKKEWQGYLEETRMHQRVVRALCEALGIAANAQTPSRKVVKHLGESLVQAMQLALKGGLAHGRRTGGLRMRGAGQDQGPCQLGTAGPGGRGGDRHHRQGIERRL